MAFENSNEPPIASKAKGVAIFAIFPIVLSIISGKSTLKIESSNPTTIPIIIGFVAIPFIVFLTGEPSISSLLGLFYCKHIYRIYVIKQELPQ